MHSYSSDINIPADTVKREGLYRPMRQILRYMAVYITTSSKRTNGKRNAQS